MLTDSTAGLPATLGENAAGCPLLATSPSTTLTVVVIAVVVGPEVWEVHPEKTDLTNRFAGPISNAPLGTDEFGRDILSRLLNGGR